MVNFGWLCESIPSIVSNPSACKRKPVKDDRHYKKTLHLRVALCSLREKDICAVLKRLFALSDLTSLYKFLAGGKLEILEVVTQVLETQKTLCFD